MKSILSLVKLFWLSNYWEFFIALFRCQKIYHFQLMNVRRFTISNSWIKRWRIFWVWWWWCRFCPYVMSFRWKRRTSLKKSKNASNAGELAGPEGDHFTDFTSAIGFLVISTLMGYHKLLSLTHFLSNEPDLSVPFYSIYFNFFFQKYPDIVLQKSCRTFMWLIT